MDVLSLLERVRGYNVAALKSRIAEHPDAFVEPALRDNAGELVGEGPLGLPARVDLVLVNDGVPTEQVTVNPEKSLSFSAFETYLHGLPLRISPFGWDYAHLRVVTPQPARDFTKLRAWFMEWFDADDVHGSDADGLYQVVHFMSDPAYIPSGFKFVLDLGSAPVTALGSLAEALIAMGAVRAEVG
jgi:hypothetical protein